MEVVTLSGTVKKFQGNGRKLGYPTANIVTASELGDGVYFGFASLADYTKKPALMFIGVPTTMGDTERRLEVHVLDIPDQDYYGETMHATIVKFHRPNQTFATVEELQAYMHADELAARQWFAKKGKC